MFIVGGSKQLFFKKLYIYIYIFFGSGGSFEPLDYNIALPLFTISLHVMSCLIWAKRISHLTPKLSICMNVKGNDRNTNIFTASYNGKL